ncbi:hypothetical protein HK103_007582 [Boothiomyces macroporosus]|uniref:Uncharacterized protein n=1 Tax=Boothiomyces macroporosus TaxID=261099 RepID=A0AAD5UCT4_9FUNG|nr:hypothetical protein HK103_007582 [Boothiomyces macroporosus]
MEEKLLKEQEELIHTSVLKHSNYDCSSFSEKQLAFAKTCSAIREIIKNKLYRLQSTNLEQYFLKRFNVSRAQVYRLMDCAAVLDCLTDISPIPHKYRICKELKKKASLGPEIRTCWEKVLAFGTSEEQLDSFDFDQIPKISAKRKRSESHLSKTVVPQSPPHSPSSAVSDSTASSPQTLASSVNDIRHTDWKRNTESLNKPMGIKPVRLPGIASFSPIIDEFEYCRSYQLNSSESVPLWNTPPGSSCACIYKGDVPRLSFKQYLNLSSPPECNVCSKPPKSSPSYEYIKSEFEKCQAALSSLAEMGYKLTPFINGRWEKSIISEWRIVPISQLQEETYPTKRLKKTSLSSNNSFDSLILAAGIL